MSGRGTPTRSIGHGALRRRVVSLINAGRARTLADLKPLMKGAVSGVALERVVARMLSDNLLVEKRGGVLGITARGAKLITLPPPPPVVGVYVPPPAPVRRPGSMDFARLPSLAAGARREWRHPV
jgi:hypothetical protein